MQAILKLTALALGAAGIIGGAALAQTTLDPARKDNPDTANYSITPGSNLKRDSSLSSTPRATPLVSNSANDTSMTTTTQTTTAVTAPLADAPVATTTTEAPVAAPVEQAMPPARADRN